MAAYTVATQILVDGPRNTVAKTTGDGTAAITAQTILDPSTLTSMLPGMAGSFLATLLRIDHIDYSITDGVIVQLYWDATTPIPVAELYGRGNLSAKRFGGYQNPNGPGTTGKLLMNVVDSGTAFPTQYSVLLLIETVKFRPLVGLGGA